MDISAVHYLITALTGAFGVGVGWGVVKGKMNYYETQHQYDRDQDNARFTRLEARQSKLRGECSPDGIPLYMSRLNCTSERATCHVMSDKIAVNLETKANINSKRIMMIENYIRYTMTKDGLSLSQITDILEHGKF